MPQPPPRLKNIPAQVHYKWDYTLPSFRGGCVFMILFLMALGGMFYFTFTIIEGPTGLWQPYYLYALLKFLAVLLLLMMVPIFWPRKRTRLLLLILHKDTGANLYIRRYQNGQVTDAHQWIHIQKAVVETTHDPHPGAEADDTIDQLWLYRLGKPRVNVFARASDDLYAVRHRQLVQCVDEINRQQNGSWKTRPLVVSDDLDTSELDVDPGWDEAAPPQTDPLAPKSSPR